MRPPVAKSQKQAAGAARILTPATERKIRNRNRTFRILSVPAMSGVFGWLAKRTTNTGALRDSAPRCRPLPFQRTHPQKHSPRSAARARQTMTRGAGPVSAVFPSLAGSLAAGCETHLR